MAEKKHKKGSHGRPHPTSYPEAKGGKDKHAHSSHHEANAHHGMSEGMQPQGGYDGGGEGDDDNGSMGDNCSYE